MVGFVRILFLFCFSLYWGGLTFYTGFVVRISHDVLNDPMDGGLITQRVTYILQTFGLAAVFLMGWNCIDVVRQSRKLGVLLIACVLLLSFALVGLYLVHGQLDAVIDANASEITNRVAFDRGHRRYNQLTTIQWLACLAYLPITVIAWQSIDRKAGVKHATD
jgi:hypothetical protein